MIKPETIQAIYDASHVDEVINEFVTLRKRGVNLIGLCPFHDEKTPSFTVSPAKGIYKCFGCGKGGNAVNFIMDHEHYTYPEALKYLAKKYNIEIIEEEQTSEQKELLNEQESLYYVSDFAQQYFSDNLRNSEEGKAIGMTYLISRGFSETMIEKFQLGYCSDKFEAFTNYALNKGYHKNHLEKSGLCIRKNDKFYDRFKGRVIFPIHNLTGKIIAFGGRILSTEKNNAKYINSPDSEIYNKSKILYGIYYARNEILKQDNCFLVEGYTDVISLHQAGIENVVASSGTSLTVEQIKLIKRFTPNITILYDGDAAGIKASFRGIDMILEEGMNVKIVLFPDGEDPDSFAKKHRNKEIEDFVKNQAKDFISFKTGLLLKEAHNDPVKKANLIKEIMQSIAMIPDGILRSVYVRECAAILNITEQTLMFELNKSLRKKYQDKFREQGFEDIQLPQNLEIEKHFQTEINFTENQEREITRLLLLYGNEEIIFNEIDEKGQKINVPIKIAEFIVHDLKNDEIEMENPEYRFIFDEFERSLIQGIVPEENHFLQFNDNQITKLTVDLISTPYELSKNWLRNKIHVKKEKDNLMNLVVSSLLSFKSKKLDQMIISNQKEMQETVDEANYMILMQEHIHLKKISREINKQLSRIIIK